MPTERLKMYLYIDETGQETRGEVFVVAVLFVPADHRETLRQGLSEMEILTKKSVKKWNKSSPKRRLAYLEAVVPIIHSFSPVYYQVHGIGTDYLERTTETLVAAVKHSNLPPESDITVVIDGLKPQERQLVSRLLRSVALPYRREVRGGRDESDSLIRLADSLVGFVRHAHEKNPYALPLWNKFGRLFHRI